MDEISTSWIQITYSLESIEISYWSCGDRCIRRRRTSYDFEAFGFRTKKTSKIDHFRQYGTSGGFPINNYHAKLLILSITDRQVSLIRQLDERAITSEIHLYVPILLRFNNDTAIAGVRKWREMRIVIDSIFHRKCCKIIRKVILYFQNQSTANCVRPIAFIQIN